MTDGRGARWTAAQLEAIDRARELEIAVVRADGGAGRWTPIWGVVVEGEVFVRTWRRRSTGWYGGALRSGRARVRVPGAAAEVVVAPADVARTREPVDAAYRVKYGAGGAGSMVTAESAASTLVLLPVGLATERAARPDPLRLDGGEDGASERPTTLPG